ncbi:MAG: hypothetical protein ACRCU2_03985 [Planktothrix sp.]
MSTNPKENPNASLVLLILGLFCLLVGVAGFGSQGEDFTLIHLGLFIIIAGFSLFLLPVFLVVALLMLSSPVIGFIFALIGLIFLYYQPILALGLGSTVTFMSLLELGGKSVESDPSSDSDEFTANNQTKDASSEAANSKTLNRNNSNNHNYSNYDNYDHDYDYERDSQENYDDWKEQMEIERGVEEQYERESGEDTYYYDED